MTDRPVLRAAREADVAAAGAVLVAESLAWAGQGLLGDGFLANAWARHDVDLDHDAWVLEDGDGRVIGVGYVLDDEPGVTGSFTVVHPDHAATRARTLLWEAAEQRARERQAGQPRPQIRHATNAGDDGENVDLVARGHHVERHFWHMQVDLEGPANVGPPPPDTTIAEITDEDLPAVHRVLMVSFADHFAHVELTYDEWHDEISNSPIFDDRIWLIARHRGQPVGVLLAGHMDGGGWVSELGVLSAARGRGIGTALLRRSLAEFADHGTSRVTLSVDAQNPTGATALYERVGMRVLRQWTVWKGDL